MDCLCSFVHFFNGFVSIQKVWSGGASTRIVSRPFWDFQQDRHLLLMWSFEEWYFYSLEFFVHFLFIYFGKPSKKKRFFNFFSLGDNLETDAHSKNCFSHDEWRRVVYIYMCECVCEGARMLKCFWVASSFQEAAWVRAQTHTHKEKKRLIFGHKRKKQMICRILRWGRLFWNSPTVC